MASETVSNYLDSNIAEVTYVANPDLSFYSNLSRLQIDDKIEAIANKLEQQNKNGLCINPPNEEKQELYSRFNKDALKARLRAIANWTK